MKMWECKNCGWLVTDIQYTSAIADFLCRCGWAWSTFQSKETKEKKSG